MAPFFHMVLGCVLLAFSAVAPAATSSECDKLSAGLREKLRHDSEPENQGYTDCKVHPGAPGHLLVVTARPDGPAGSAASDETTYDLDLALVRTSDERIVKRSRFRRAFESDAIVFSRLALDTARYILAPGVARSACAPIRRRSAVPRRTSGST